MKTDGWAGADCTVVADHAVGSGGADTAGAGGHALEVLAALGRWTVVVTVTLVPTAGEGGADVAGQARAGGGVVDHLTLRVGSTRRRLA